MAAKTVFGKDSATANDPWAEFVEAGRAGTGWSNNRLVNMEVATTALNDTVADAGKSVSEDVNGLAFKFNISAANIAVEKGTHIILDNATMVPFANGKEYALVKIGAIASNDADATLTLENLSKRTLDIPVNYLCDLSEDSAGFAIRIINIPDANKDSAISVRPYYVLSNGEETIVIYDETVTGTYNATHD